MNKKLISLIVPCYNEKDVLPIFFKEIYSVLQRIQNYQYEIIFVNDGSTDSTLNCLIEYQKKDHNIVILDLSRNFGKESALTAGLQYAKGDAVIPLDADLQDPPALILDMIANWEEGHDVVLARRIKRSSDSLWKRVTAKYFYRIHNLFADQKIPENVGDFRLMDRCVVDAVNRLPERCRFMKGLLAWVGFKAICIDYERPVREAGKTKFHIFKLWNFALDGITGFSTIPLRMWTYLGVFFAFSAFIYASLIFVKVLLYGVDVPGYASLMVAIMFMGGLQLMGIGIIGEYLGRNYMESKKRPNFIVRKLYKIEENNSC